MYGLAFKIAVLEAIKEITERKSRVSARDIVEYLKTNYSKNIDNFVYQNIYNRVLTVLRNLLKNLYLSRFEEKTHTNIYTYYYTVTKKITFIDARPKSE